MGPRPPAPPSIECIFSFCQLVIFFCDLFQQFRAICQPLLPTSLPPSLHPIWNPASATRSVGDLIFKCFGLLLALGRKTAGGGRGQGRGGAITPPDIPEIGVKPNKLGCADSPHFHQTDNDRIPFLPLTMPRMPLGRERERGKKSTASLATQGNYRAKPKLSISCRD